MPLRPEMRSKWPPGGWQYYQPQTGWEAPEPLANTFQQQVQNIIKHRKANPRFGLSLDEIAVADELDDYTCARLRHHIKFCEVQKKSISPVSQLSSLLRKSVELVAGVEPSALEDWLGADKKPVPEQQAHRRAAVCAVCPQNVTKGWRDWLTAPVAFGIHKYIEAKNNLKLTTPSDDMLGVCKVCRCHLPLKVHVPLKYIVENTDEETFAELDSKCWVLSEK